MKNTLQTLVLGIILALATTQALNATEKKAIITIEQMEINLATLAKEISEEKVKLFQKEALLNDMKLALLKEKEARK